MFDHWYAVDVGAYACKFYDYSKESETTVRSCIAWKDRKLTAVGKDALMYLYDMDPSVTVKYPVHHDQILSNVSPIIKKGMKELDSSKNVFRSSLFICLPTDISERNKNRWQQELLKTGVQNVRFTTVRDILETTEPTMIIHSGHSYTELGIYANGKTYVHKTIFYAGEQMDENIQNMIRQYTQCDMTLEDACSLKEATSQSFWDNKNRTLSCNVRQRNGQIARMNIKASDIWPCMENVCQQITLWAQQCLEEVDVNLKESVHENGVLLSGGLARCFGVRQSLEYTLNCPVICTDTPEMDILENMKGWK